MLTQKSFLLANPKKLVAFILTSFLFLFSSCLENSDLFYAESIPADLPYALLMDKVEVSNPCLPHPQVNINNESYVDLSQSNPTNENLYIGHRSLFENIDPQLSVCDPLYNKPMKTKTVNFSKKAKINCYWCLWFWGFSEWLVPNDL